MISIGFTSELIHRPDGNYRVSIHSNRRRITRVVYSETGDILSIRHATILETRWVNLEDLLNAKIMIGVDGSVLHYRMVNSSKGAVYIPARRLQDRFLEVTYRYDKDTGT